MLDKKIKPANLVRLTATSGRHLSGDYALHKAPLRCPRMARVVQARYGSRKPDIWLTVSGWIWLGYAAGLLALLTAAAA